MSFKSSLAPALFGLLISTCLSSCNEGRTCVDSDQCGAGAACVTADATGTCFSLCASQSACSEGEFCLPRVEEAPNAVLVWPEVCVPSEMLLPFEPSPMGCAARSLDECDTDSSCTLDVGWRLDRSRRCREPMPAACIGRQTVCLNSVTLAHNAEGELFVFNSYCGPHGFAPLYLEPGDPLYEELFGIEPIAYSWPECD